MLRRLVVAACAALPALATAQTAPSVKETVTVTATGEELPVGEASAASTVIDGDEVRRTGASALADVLRLVPGATVVRSGLDNNVTSVFIRGTNSNQTLVMWDGVRLNSPFFGGYDWSQPLAVGIGRVEVVRGPYSALYGADAIGGVVNLLPSAPAGNRVRASVEGGSDGWRWAEAAVSLAGNGWDVVATGGRRSGTGPLVNDDFATSTAMASLGVTLGPRSRLGVLARWTDSDTQIPFSGGVATPHRSTAARETLVALPLHLELAPTVHVEVAASHVRRSLAFRDPDDPWGFVASDTTADSTGARAALRVAAGVHRLAIGGEWREDTVSDGSSLGSNLDRRRITTRAGFVQDIWTLSPRLELLAGARWDRATPWGSEVSPRATLTWRGDRVRTWLAYGHAFRAPGLGELYYPFSGNPALEPEHAEAWEIGSSARTGTGSVQVVAFSSRVRNLIDFDYASFAFANVGRARQDGAEVSVVAALQSDLRVRTALTYVDARDGRDQPLLRRPTWSGSSALSASFGRSTSCELALIWVGPRTDVDPVTLARVRQPGFVTANATGRVVLREGFAIRLRVENLAARRYEEVRGYPAVGRRAMVGFEAGF